MQQIKSILNSVLIFMAIALVFYTGLSLQSKYHLIKEDKNVNTVYITRDSLKTDVKIVPKYIYIKDTTHTTDTVNVFEASYHSDSLNIYYYSYSPIDTSGWFKVDFTPTVIEVEKKQTFFNRFSFSINSGLGYGVFTKKPDLFIGLGISYRIR